MLLLGQVDFKIAQLDKLKKVIRAIDCISIIVTMALKLKKTKY